VIAADPAVTLGHELIHALQFARGEAIPTPTLLGDVPMLGTVNPVSGGVESVGELNTITGQKTFRMNGTEVTFNVSTDISENDLRRERNLEDRLSHEGATAYVNVTARAGTTLQSLVDRYRTDTGATTSGPVRAAIERAIARRYGRVTWPLKVDLPELQLPSVEHIRMYVLLNERNQALSEQISMLTGP
jgi:hypothetical protein